jgi:hypothetical protein
MAPNLELVHSRGRVPHAVDLVLLQRVHQSLMTGVSRVLATTAQEHQLELAIDFGGPAKKAGKVLVEIKPSV